MCPQEKMPTRAFRVLVRLNSLKDGPDVTRTTLDYPSGIKYCVDQGLAEEVGDCFRITVEGEARFAVEKPLHT